MKLLSLLSIGGLLLCTACTAPKLLIEDHTAELRQARTVATAFYQDFGKDVKLKDVPFVTISVDGGSGYSYDQAHNVLFITPFEHADFDTQKFFSRAAPGDTTAQSYNSLLFEFYAAHQLMHLLYDALPLDGVSHYEEELRINVLTLIFLRKHKFSEVAESGWLSVMDALEAQLVSRFPGAGESASFARALDIDNNASFCYVSAVNFQEAHQIAAGFKSERAYVTQLTSAATASSSLDLH